MTFTVNSPAKINWTLRVLGKRPDGFHELESLVSAISLFDRLTFAACDEPGFHLECDCPDLSTGTDNLICRAAQLLAETAAAHGAAAPLGPHSPGLRCRLEKRIPMGGGLGGGSSNAAATLTALNTCWNLNWPRDRLSPLAAQLGSDVPFFLHGHTAWMRGRGERIQPASLPWHGSVVLLCPGLHVATAAVYAAWRDSKPDTPPAPTPSKGAAHEASGFRASTPAKGAAHEASGFRTPDPTRRAAHEVSGFRTPAHSEEIPLCSSAVDWMHRAYNALEAPAQLVCPALRDIMVRAAALAQRPVRMSGSGSTLFTAYDDPAEADQFARQATALLGIAAHVVQPLTL